MLQVMFYVRPPSRDTIFKTFGTVLLAPFSTRKICVLRGPFRHFPGPLLDFSVPFRFVNHQNLHAQIDSKPKKEFFIYHKGNHEELSIARIYPD